MSGSSQCSYNIEPIGKGHSSNKKTKQKMCIQTYNLFLSSETVINNEISWRKKKYLPESLSYSVIRGSVKLCLH